MVVLLFTFLTFFFNLLKKGNDVNKIFYYLGALLSLNVSNVFAQYGNDMTPQQRDEFYNKYQSKAYKYEGSYGSHLNQQMPGDEYKKELNSSYTIKNNILPGQASGDFWSRPRRIYLKRAQSGEVAEIFYYKDGKIDPQQYWLASYMLRDYQSKKMTYVDPKLLDLLAAVQAWIVYYGNNNPIVINSGFRTVEYNKKLKGSATNSMHLYGKAVDFKVEGLTVKQLAAIASYFKAGGIGMYYESGFLHMDTGGIRVWYGK